MLGAGGKGRGGVSGPLCEGGGQSLGWGGSRVPPAAESTRAGSVGDPRGEGRARGRGRASRDPQKGGGEGEGGEGLALPPPLPQTLPHSLKMAPAPRHVTGDWPRPP